MTAFAALAGGTAHGPIVPDRADARSPRWAQEPLRCAAATMRCEASCQACAAAAPAKPHSISDTAEIERILFNMNLAPVLL